MSLTDKFRSLKSLENSKKPQDHRIGVEKAFNKVSRHEKGSIELVADSRFIEFYSSRIEPFMEESDYGGISFDCAELNSLYRREKNRQIHDHPGGFDVGYSVDYNFGVAVGKTANEKYSLVDNPEIVRTVDGILQYRPTTSNPESAKIMKDGAVEWEDIIRDLEE